MKKLIVPSIAFYNKIDLQKIDFSNWDTPTEKPIVHFLITHNNDNIFLNFKVTETSIRAKVLEDNGKVWEDSCVEAFFMPENDGIYYNFEFNCIGTKLLAVGNSRHNRELATKEILDKITVKSSFERQIFEEKIGNFNWELTIKIPIDCFFKHQINALKNKNFRANFYKCGDALLQPHFLSWTKIDTAQPDFHTPQYFGQISFI